MYRQIRSTWYSSDRCRIASNIYAAVLKSHGRSKIYTTRSKIHTFKSLNGKGSSFSVFGSFAFHFARKLPQVSADELDSLPKGNTPLPHLQINLTKHKTKPNVANKMCQCRLQLPVTREGCYSNSKPKQLIVAKLTLTRLADRMHASLLLNNQIQSELKQDKVLQRANGPEVVRTSCADQLALLHARLQTSYTMTGTEAGRKELGELSVTGLNEMEINVEHLF